MIDLGNGHVFDWFADSTGRIVGLIERHENPEDFPACSGGGYIAWVASGDLIARHQLVSGGPDDVEHLTISPSLWHRARDQEDTSLPQSKDGSRNAPGPDCHGWIRNGRWARA